MSGALPPAAFSITARLAVRVALALARWAEKRPREEEQQAAEDLTHDPALTASCSSWALGVADQAFRPRKRAHLPRFVRSGTRSTRWVWQGAVWADGTRIEPLGKEYAPRSPDEALPGDVLTVGPRGKSPAHTTIIIAVVRRGGRIVGFWCIGFNQVGEDRDGGRVAGGLALTYYPRDPGPGFSAHKLVTVPLSAYEAGPAPVTVDPDLVESGKQAFLEQTGIDLDVDQPASPVSPPHPGLAFADTAAVERLARHMSVDRLALGADALASIGRNRDAAGAYRILAARAAELATFYGAA